MNGRTDYWWIKMFTEDIPDTIWKKNCRMNKITFFELAEILRPMINSDTNSSNYRSVSNEKIIAVVLYCMKDTRLDQKFGIIQ